MYIAAFLQRDGIRFKDVITTTQGWSPLHCVRQCTQHSQCAAVNVEEQGGVHVCQLAIGDTTEPGSSNVMAFYKQAVHVKSSTTA